MAQYRIWYSDGTSLSDADGTHLTLPVWGVICVIDTDPQDPQGFIELSGGEVYWYDGAQWVSGNQLAALNENAKAGGNRFFLGEQVSNSDFDTIIAQARAQGLD